MVAENKPGQVPTTNISGNAGKQIYRTTNTSSALPHPESSKAERCAFFLNGVNMIANHSDVVIKARSTGLRWDLG
jgi:hypothetical protein